jgi:curved DNA-binding protein CbpA
LINRAFLRVRDFDFSVHYEALGLEPGASDQEIARAKRAYNELYHSDRLAHMSGAAQAIAAEKVRAANESARVLLDPSRRAARDQWVRERGIAGEARPTASEAAESRPDPATLHRDAPRPARRIAKGVKLGWKRGGGALLGAGAFLIRAELPRRYCLAHSGYDCTSTTTPSAPAPSADAPADRGF